MRPLQFFRLTFGLLLLTACQTAQPTPSPPLASPTDQAEPAAIRPSTKPTEISTPMPQAAPSAVALIVSPHAPTAQPTSLPTSAPDGFTEATPTPIFPDRPITSDTLANLQPLRTVGLGDEYISEVSPDGSLLAVGTSAGIAWYSLPDLRHLRFTPIEQGVGPVLQFTPDGQQILINPPTLKAPKGEVEVRSIIDGTLQATFEGRNPTLSPDGHMIATHIETATNTKVVTIWDRSTGRKLTTLPGGLSETAASSPFSPDSQLIATLEPSSQKSPIAAFNISIWRISDGVRVRRIAESRMPAFSPDGQWVATFQDETQIGIWSVDGSQPDQMLPQEPKGTVRLLAFDQHNRLLVVAANDNRLLAWDMASQQFTEQVSDLPEITNPGYCQDLHFTADGSILVIGGITTCESLPMSVEIIRTSDGQRLYQDQEITAVNVNKTNTHIVVRDYDFIKAVVDLQHQTTISLESLLPEIGMIKAITFSPDGLTLASGGQLLTFWDVVTGMPTDSTETFANDPGLLGFQDGRIQYTPDGQRLVFDGKLYYFEVCLPTGVAWQVQGNTIGERLWEENAWCYWMTPRLVDWAFDPNSGASISSNGKQPLDSEQMRGIALSMSVPITATAVEFSPDGSIVALGDDQGMVHLYRNDGALLSSVPFESPAEMMRFSPDGTRLGVIRSDGVLQILNLGDNQLGQPIPLASQPHTMILSNDHRLAIVADAQGVTFYSLPTGASLKTIPVSAEDLAIGPRQRILAILHDGQVQLWGIQP